MGELDGQRGQMGDGGGRGGTVGADSGDRWGAGGRWVDRGCAGGID